MQFPLPGSSRPPDKGQHSALHNKVNKFCASHKGQILRTFAVNPGGLRNGCLIFWKLSPPNLIPGLVRLPTDRPKSVCEQQLS